MSQAERIVAMSLATGIVASTIHSAIWAIAASYMTRQKALASIAQARAYLDDDTLPEVPLHPLPEALAQSGMSADLDDLLALDDLVGHVAP